MKFNYKKYIAKSLFRNSLFMMTSTGIMSGFGFLFWVIGSRYYSVENIGLATTLISTLTLVTNFSVLGLNSGLIRFMPGSNDKNHKISGSLVLTLFSSVIFSTLLFIVIKLWLHKLDFLLNSYYGMVVFMIAIILSSFFLIFDGIFWSYKSAQYILIKGLVFSIVKLLLPIVLISLSFYGIFASWVAGLCAAVLISFAVIYIRFNFSFTYKINFSSFRKMFLYSLGSNVNDLSQSLPTMVLPIIITTLLSAKFTAYYYMPMMIASLLYVIPQAANQSLFSEGSHDERNLRSHAMDSIKLVLMLLIPASLGLLIFGRPILNIFGPEYSIQGYPFLILLVLSGFFVSLNYIFESIYKVKKEIKRIVSVAVFQDIVVIGLCIYLLRFGLIGVGIAWLIGQFLVTLVYLFTSRKIFDTSTSGSH